MLNNQPVLLKDSELLYSIRMVVLLEDAPFSNKYHQVLLNAPQFMLLGQTIMGMFPAMPKGELREGFEANKMQLSDQLYMLPDSIRDIN